MAWLGEAWRGKARVVLYEGGGRLKVWQGEAWRGKARQGAVR